MKRVVPTPPVSARPVKPRASDGRLTHLTRREVDILHGVVCGQSNVEIGAALGLREQTVKNHISVLLQKLQVRNRVQLAVLVARQWPWLVPEGS
jgi:DNA-binding NarL/FixJ family response regulator